MFVYARGAFRFRIVVLKCKLLVIDSKWNIGSGKYYLIKASMNMIGKSKQIVTKIEKEVYLS